MNNLIKIYIFLFCVCAFGVTPSFAQIDYDSVMQPRESRFDSIMQVKEDIAILLEENARLEQQYLQSKQVYERVGSVQPRQKVVKKPIKEQQFKNKSYANPILRAPMVSDRQRGLLELELADLHLFKEELELELKLKNYSYQEDGQTDINRRAELKNKLTKSIYKEKNLIQELSELEEYNLVAPEKSAVLKLENKTLESMLVGLEKKVEIKRKEVSLLRDKGELVKKSSEGLALQIEKEHEELKKEILTLETQKGKLTETVQTGLSRQSRKQDLTQKIVQYDKENQRLKAALSSLKEKNNLTKE